MSVCKAKLSIIAVICKVGAFEVLQMMQSHKLEGRLSIEIPSKYHKCIILVKSDYVLLALSSNYYYKYYEGWMDRSLLLYHVKTTERIRMKFDMIVCNLDQKIGQFYLDSTYDPLGKLPKTSRHEL